MLTVNDVDELPSEDSRVEMAELVRPRGKPVDDKPPGVKGFSLLLLLLLVLLLIPFNVVVAAPTDEALIPTLALDFGLMR